jgi:eukaryotic-like serine/threonine-protein kinase
MSPFHFMSPRSPLPGRIAVRDGSDGRGTRKEDGAGVREVSTLRGTQAAAPGVAAPPEGSAAVLGPKTEFLIDGLRFAGTESVHGSGRYHIEGECRRGAMGAIFRAFDTHLGREVALKFLLEEHKENPELRERFLQEARITARLQHPGVVPVYDLHRTSGNGLFFSMMFVHGATLKELLKKRVTSASDISRFLTVFEKICQTMGFAHSLGVIHRDLKPANFMIGAFGVVRVMDWGLAKVLGERRVGHGPAAAARPGASPKLGAALGGGRPESGLAAGAAMGTLAYMAPEQARGETELIDERADVFGLGAVLCEILTGLPPYTGSTVDELYRRALQADLGEAMDRLERCLAEPRLLMLAKQCLSARPADRPHDAGEVAAIMTAQLESELQRTALDMVRFFELSHDLFCLASLDGYFQRVNDNFARVLGYTKTELLARPFLDFVHPGDVAQTLAQMEKLSRGLPVVCFRNRYRDAAGVYHWLEWTAKSLPEEKVIFAVARPDSTGGDHLTH